MVNKEEEKVESTEKQEENEEEDIEKIMRNSDVIDVLVDYTKAKSRYAGAKQRLDIKKATLRLKTDWSKVFPEQSKITKDDKEAHITLKTKKQVEEVNQTEVYKEMLYELLRIKKLQLEARVWNKKKEVMEK